LEAKDVVSDALGRIQSIVHRALKRVTVDDIHRQPSGETNSIAWLVWHLTRVQDDALSALAGQEQAWISEGWHEQFALPADPDMTGFDDTPAQVSAFRIPTVQLILDYHDRVVERSRRYVEALAAEDFDRTLDEPQWQPLPTVGVRLVSVLADNLQHAGQAVYLRGLFQGRGWQTL
jgi:hypothetical protein